MMSANRADAKTSVFRYDYELECECEHHNPRICGRTHNDKEGLLQSYLKLFLLIFYIVIERPKSLSIAAIFDNSK